MAYQSDKFLKEREARLKGRIFRETYTAKHAKQAPTPRKNRAWIFAIPGLVLSSIFGTLTMNWPIVLAAGAIVALLGVNEFLRGKT